MSPPIFLCDGQPHEIHTKFWLSKCNFLTRCGLHEIYAMSRKLTPQNCSMYAMVLRGGVVIFESLLSHFGIDATESLLSHFHCPETIYSSGGSRAESRPQL